MKVVYAERARHDIADIYAASFDIIRLPHSASRI